MSDSKLTEIKKAIDKRGHVYLDVNVPPASRPKECKKESPCFYPCEVRSKYTEVKECSDDKDVKERYVLLKYKETETKMKLSDIVISDDQRTKSHACILNTDVKKLIDTKKPARIVYGPTGTLKYISEVPWAVGMLTEIREKTRGGGGGDYELLIEGDTKTILYSDTCIILAEILKE